MSDIFISFGSTATIDALIAGKPVIYPAFKGWPFCEFFEKTKAVFSPKTTKELNNLIAKLLTNKKIIIKNTLPYRDKFVLEMTANCKGDATDQISNSILLKLDKEDE